MGKFSSPWTATESNREAGQPIVKVSLIIPSAHVIAEVAPGHWGQSRDSAHTSRLEGATTPTEQVYISTEEGTEAERDGECAQMAQLARGTARV